MYEYKVDIYKLKYCAEAMNTYAKAGWRVIAVTPYHMDGFVDVFYEREVGTGTPENEVQIPDEAKPEIKDEAADNSTEAADDAVDIEDDIFGVFEKFTAETD